MSAVICFIIMGDGGGLTRGIQTLPFGRPTRLALELLLPMNFSTTTALSAVGSTGGIDARLLERLFDHTPDIAFFIGDRQGRYVGVTHCLPCLNRSHVLK